MEDKFCWNSDTCVKIVNSQCDICVNKKSNKMCNKCLNIPDDVLKGKIRCDLLEIVDTINLKSER